MHDHLGRPTFRPNKVEVLNTGVQWAFLGSKGRGFVLKGPNEASAAKLVEALPFSVTEMNQWAETRILAGARDEDIATLRGFGYNPEAVAQSFRTRVAFEQDFAEALRSGVVKPRDSAELRVYVQAREVIHEHLDLLRELFAEFQISIERAFGSDSLHSRQKMVEFFDSVPSVQVAVDLKTHLFRNPQKVWTSNAVRDIDFLGAAVPYCQIVIADREMTDLLARSATASMLGTTVVRKIADLVDLLPRLERQAAALGPDRTGWGGSSFCLNLPVDIPL
ncbi:hypothetical protein QM616_18860 [Rhodococcus fascians]|uniref:hypothetical protein n=1 Tax=Rhodococcoides fascians TaxID=1828 RepID=UPI0024B64A34|nr:hypothetical protein [Rhodococcus fascians]MDJ0004788.1 hypothetical protein [Rhodococcus fascians]